MKSSELQRSAAVLNLAEVDTTRIVDGFRYGHFAWAGLVVELPTVTAMLLLEVGPAALFGIGILFWRFLCRPSLRNIWVAFNRQL